MSLSPGLSLFQGNLRKPGKESFSEGQKLGCYFSVTKSCPTFCNSMYCSMPVFPVPHHLPEFAQMQVHWIDDGIKVSGPLSSSSPLVPNFPRIRVFSNELAPSIRWPKYWSFSLASAFPVNIQNLFPLGLTGLNSLQSKGLIRIFSSTAIQKHQFFDTQSSVWFNFHICMWSLDISQQINISTFTCAV